MEDAIKLKPVGWIQQIGLPIIVLSLIFFGVLLIVGELSFQLILAGVMSIMVLFHLILLGRTHNRIYLVPLSFYFFTAVTFFTISLNFYLTVTCATVAGVSFIGLMYVLVTRKMKWRYREVLELAARSVQETKDGFTARPYPAGEAHYTRAEVVGLAQFLLKQAIAYPFFESNRVVLVVPSNMIWYFFGIKRNYQGDTYVAFANNEQVTVQVAAKDYQKYTEALSFDQLCFSFGNLFKEFLGLYQNGESQKIIERMNALRFVM